MAGKEFPLSLLIKAVDRATEPLRRVNKRIHDFTAPVRRLSNSFRALATEAGLPRLAAGFRAVGHAVGRVGSAVWSLGKRFALLGVAAGYVFYRILSGTIKAGDDLATFSKRVGMTADAFAQLRFAAEQSDVEAEQFAKGMDYFNKAIGEAKAGTGALTTLLKKTSPAFLNQLMHTKNAEQALGLMTKSFVKITDPTKRAALAAAAFGRSGQQIGVWLSEGGAQIDEQRKRYAELSGSQQEFADNSAKLDNALRETGMAFAGLRNVALAKLMPAFEKIAKWLTGFLMKHRDSIAAWAERAGKAIEAWVDGGGLDRLIDAFREVIAGITRASTAVKEATLSISSIERSIDRLASKTEIVRAVLRAFTDPLLQIPTLVRSAFGPVLMMPNLLRGIVSPFVALADVVVTQVEMIGEAFTNLWTAITSGFDRVRPVLEKLAPVLSGASPIGALYSAYQTGSNLLGSQRPALPIDRAAGPRAAPQETHVTIDVNGLPRGARVTRESGGTAPLDLNLGYSMVTP